MSTVIQFQYALLNFKNNQSMRTKIAIIFTIVDCFFIQNPLWSQDQHSNCNIKQYSYYVNLAELSITDSLYEQAIQFYDSAVVFIPSAFARDRYNKAVCLALTGNFEKCKKSLLYLLEKGLSREIIIENRAFESFLLSQQGKELLEKKPELTYNTNLRSIYDSIFEADQYFRRIHPHNYHDYYHDTISKIDASNVKFMNDLIKNYGWPDEDLIGIYFPQTAPYEIIIIHQHKSDYQIYNYTEHLMNAFESCHLTADKAAWLIADIGEKDETSIFASGYVMIVYDPEENFQMDSLTNYRHKIGFYDIESEKKLTLDIRRKAFGLSSIDDYRRKVLFGLRDKLFMFIYKGGKTTLTVSDIEQYEYMTKNLKEF